MYVGSSLILLKSEEQPCKVANPARGQLHRKNELIFSCPRSRLRIWSREIGSAVSSRAILLILHNHKYAGIGVGIGVIGIRVSYS